MQKGFHLRIALPSVLASALLTASCGIGPAAAESGRDPVNLYREGDSSYLGSATSTALARVYVPNVKSNDVYLIDPASYKVIGYFKVGRHPHHGLTVFAATRPILAPAYWNHAIVWPFFCRS